MSSHDVSAPPDPRWRPSAAKLVAAAVLLVGVTVPLLVGTYSRIDPRLFGFPFFYWYQLAWVFIAAGICGIAYVLIRRDEARFRREHGDQGGRVDL